jgi:hypothetical protein
MLSRKPPSTFRRVWSYLAKTHGQARPQRFVRPMSDSRSTDPVLSVPRYSLQDHILPI